LIESDVVSHPLDDEGPLEAGRAVDPAGASTVSACGEAIVISASVGRPHVEQNRASLGTLAPQVGQGTVGFYLRSKCISSGSVIRDPWLGALNWTLETVVQMSSS
jgi:hypothetical protein